MRSCLSVLAVALLPLLSVHAEEPSWLTEARAREGKLTKPVAIKAKDGSFSAAVPAKPVDSKIVKEDGSYSVSFKIGSDSPVECEIDPDGFDLATLLKKAAEATLPLIEQAQGKVEKNMLERVDAGAIGSTPFVAADWLYRVNTAKGARLGSMKQIVARKHGYGIYCVHIEVGYANTFRGVVAGLLETFKPAELPPAPYYTEIMTAEVSGKRIGVAQVTMERDADGDTRIESKTSMALPVGEGAMQAQDEVTIQFTRPDGSLINSVYIESANGELEANLQLKRDDNDKWKVTGEYKGKQLDVAPSAKTEPQSMVESTFAIRALLAQSAAVGKSITSTRWTPSADPTKFLPVKTTALRKLDDGLFEIKEGMRGLEVTAVVEPATGSARSAAMQVGPVAIEMKRVFIDGSF